MWRGIGQERKEEDERVPAPGLHSACERRSLPISGLPAVARRRARKPGVLAPGGGGHMDHTRRRQGRLAPVASLAAATCRPVGVAMQKGGQPCMALEC